ncbi:hypothetical protein [Antrihabitans spumae]|uniref:N-acetyltransferase domain-containing protein n=1 Tax=Antrihabitans spumae TaxID=3373370 RepID=A0ABW7KV38_9NOCA
METDAASYRLVTIAGASSAYMIKVIALGDHNRRTLGFLPRAGYIEAANRQHVIAAITHDDTLAAYCIFDPTEKYVRIVHICVDTGHTGKKLAARLITEVSERNSHLPGLRLKCRRDWPADSMWPKLGFQPQTDVRGRSAAGHLLTVWWRPNVDNFDLFSLPPQEIDSPIVAVDSNVFSDLHTQRKERRDRFSGSVALLAGDQQITLAVPFSVPSELNKTVDANERNRLVQTASTYRKLSGNPAEVASTKATILSVVPPDAIDSDPSLRTDAQLLAEAIVGGANIFLTRDDNAVRQLGTAAFDRFGIAVIDPSELKGFLHRREHWQDYQPARLAETTYEITRGDHSEWNSPKLANMLNNADGERRSAFKRRLKDLAEESTQQVQRSLLHAPDGTLMAAWAVDTSSPERLRIPFLRVNPSELSSTVARQIIFSLRRTAVSLSSSAILVEDPYISRTTRALLEVEGFAAGSGGVAIAYVISKCSAWEEVRRMVMAAGGDLSMLESACPTAEQIAELERIWWPVKIIDGDLPNYFVPIKSNFAYELLGHANTLISRSVELGLSREHVYYRSARMQLQAPARLLWYSSEQDMQVVACSRLLESSTGTPESLYQSFKQLGVWNLSMIRNAADDKNRVGVLRFTDTEIFERPIPLNTLRRFSGAKLPSQGPRRIDNSLFKILYDEGTLT